MEILAFMMFMMVAVEATPTGNGKMEGMRTIDTIPPEARSSVFIKLCELECYRLNCVESLPVPEGKNCTCFSCKVPSLQLSEGKHGTSPKRKPLPYTLETVNIKFNNLWSEANNSDMTEFDKTEKHQPVTVDVSPKEKKLLNHTCNIECSRLGCVSYAMSTTNDEMRCHCHSCPLGSQSTNPSKESREKRSRYAESDSSVYLTSPSVAVARPSRYGCLYRKRQVKSVQQCRRPSSSGSWWSRIRIRIRIRFEFSCPLVYFVAYICIDYDSRADITVTVPRYTPIVYQAPTPRYYY
jgi:hypothetical protein